MGGREDARGEEGFLHHVNIKGKGEREDFFPQKITAQEYRE